MKTVLTIALAAVLQFAAMPSMAETINIGRSDVRLMVPEGYNAAKPAPLVVLLHGYSASGMMQEIYMQFGKLVNEYQFLYLIPDGTQENSEKKNRFWNATDACCNTYGSEVDDSTYIRDLITAVSAEYSVDKNRIYLIGHSNGGFMSHRLAYDYPETIAAIASLAGASLMTMEGDAPAQPVNILQIHGTDDPTVKYQGGTFAAGIAYPSASESMEKWVAYSGAAADGQKLEKTLDLDESIDGAETTIERFDKAGNIELWSIHGGAHVPKLSANFTRDVIEWLFEHPKS